MLPLPDDKHMLLKVELAWTGTALLPDKNEKVQNSYLFI